MSEIEGIEIIIRDLIRTNEALVSYYDSEMLCSDYENTKDILKELYDRKNELMESLEDTTVYDAHLKDMYEFYLAYYNTLQ